MKSGSVICRLPGSEQWGVFTEPAKVICRASDAEINPALAELEKELKKGNYAAGFISYETGAAFDKAFPKNSGSGFPLLWFGIYSSPPAVFKPPEEEIFAAPPELQAETSETEYHQAVDEILADIKAGNLYQVNFTFRLRGGKTADPWHLFQTLFVRHPAPYAAFINTGDFQIVSLSPEMFLERKGDRLFNSPMKGTIKRDCDPAADKRNAGFLKTDPKNTAENLMIVDMVRNDLGRVCLPDSIFVDPLFHVDSYPTLHQMISTVHGEVAPGTAFSDIVRATFPAASITGAPKVAAMHKIQKLEKSPRKIYTGSIGCIYPNRDFCMNVAIRTLICHENSTELGVGGGIVYDSAGNAELDEALLKSRFVHAAEPDFRILETMLFEDGRISDLDAHLKRMQKSAEFFNFRFDKKAAGKFVFKQIAGLATGAPGRSRIRLLLDFTGKLELQAFPLEKTGWNREPAKVKISEERVSSADIFLRHKTTRRDFYDEHFKKAVAEGYDEVIFTNERGEICEGAISNIFVQAENGAWYTPPLTCGLLPGIWRAKMLEELNAEEKVLYLDDLKQAKKIIIGNSVRKIVSCEIKK
ncbi:MAG: chorismate-binding protein [Victivallaceae bacterium]|nr:chorismate-binding protein [Victivallaceae bacterium]